jgi:DNA-binding MarR family transcriptional regulator
VEKYTEILEAMKNFIIFQEIRSKEKITVPGKSTDPRSWNITQLHAVSLIQEHCKVNNAMLSQMLNISKAAVAKIIKTFLKEALIVETPSNNKKEKHYTLTEKGIELAGVHTQVYEQMVRCYVRVFKTFTDEEINTVIRFLNSI